MTLRSTPIYMPSTVTTIEDWLTSLREGSHAPHFLQQENVSEKLTIETCSQKPYGSYGKYDQATSSWKMSEDWLTALTPTQKKSLGSFPRQGTMQDGVCVPQKKQELRTKDIDGGVSQTGVMFPTPANQEPGWKHLELIDRHGCSPPCHPNQRFYDKNTGRLVQKGLTQMASWPTPDSSARGPCAVDLIAENGKSVFRRISNQRRGINLETATKINPGDNSKGGLNPDWVEWLMGLPKGFTSLEPLPEGSYEEWKELSSKGMWWANEPDMPRLAEKVKDRKRRLKSLGNGIVPATLTGFIEDINGRS